MEMGLFMNSPATSVDVERFLSILSSFVEVRPKMLENKLTKLVYSIY